MSLLSELSSLVGDAFEEAGLDRRLGVVVVSQRPDLAQFQCNGALAGAKQAGRQPRLLAEEIAERVLQDVRVSAADIAGPGFLNITVTDAHLADQLSETSGDDRLGLQLLTEPTKVIVDYGGPNVAKDLHVGHIRPALIGESIKRTYALAGHEVLGDVHLATGAYPWASSSLRSRMLSLSLRTSRLPRPRVPFQHSRP